MALRRPWPEALAKVALGLGVVVGIGLLTAWFLRPTGLWFFGLLAMVFAAPFALLFGLVAAAGLGLRRARGAPVRRRAAAGCGAAVVLAFTGLGVVAGVVPQEVLPEALTIVVSADAEPGRGHLRLGRGETTLAEFPFVLPAEGSTTLRTPPLAPGRYDLEVRLEDGRAEHRPVSVGAAAFEVLVVVGPGGIFVSQAHGD